MFHVHTVAMFFFSAPASSYQACLRTNHLDGNRSLKGIWRFASCPGTNKTFWSSRASGDWRRSYRPGFILKPRKRPKGRTRCQNPCWLTDSYIAETKMLSLVSNLVQWIREQEN